MFENLSGLKNIDFLIGITPQELLDQINTIRLPCRIISIYAVGSRHIAWVQCTSKLKKVKKETIIEDKPNG